LVTLTRVPKGRLRCAAVSFAGSIRSPEAVREVSAYHDARPHCAAAVCVKIARHSMAAADASSVILIVPGTLSNRRQSRTRGRMGRAGVVPGLVPTRLIA